MKKKKHTCTTADSTCTDTYEWYRLLLLLHFFSILHGVLALKLSNRSKQFLGSTQHDDDHDDGHDDDPSSRRSLLHDDRLDNVLEAVDDLHKGRSLVGVYSRGNRFCFLESARPNIDAEK